MNNSLAVPNQPSWPLSPYDAEAAVRGGMKPMGVLTGGFSEQQLREAGCVEVYPEVGAILRT